MFVAARWVKVDDGDPFHSVQICRCVTTTNGAWVGEQTEVGLGNEAKNLVLLYIIAAGKALRHPIEVHATAACQVCEAVALTYETGLITGCLF